MKIDRLKTRLDLTSKILMLDVIQETEMFN